MKKITKTTINGITIDIIKRLETIGFKFMFKGKQYGGHYVNKSKEYVIKKAKEFINNLK